MHKNNKPQSTFSDIDLAFNIHPSRKDLVLSLDEQAIIRSIRNLILTNHYERLFHPEIGSNISRMLFEPPIALTSNILVNEISTTIKNFEPRVKLIDVAVEVKPDSNYLTATITFLISNYTRPTTIELPLNRNIL